MRNQPSSLLLVLLLVGCEGITSSTSGDVSYHVQELDVQYRTDVSEQVQNLITGFSSVSHFSKAEELKVRITQDSPTNLVLALNEKDLPIFASYQENNQLYSFGYEQTALSLLSMMTSHYKLKDRSLLTTSFQKHSDFNKLISRLEHLSKKNRSFIYDKVTLKYVNNIAIDITNNYFDKTSTSDPSFNHTISESDQFTVTGNTKLPFKLSLKDLVRNESASSKIHTGVKLDTEMYPSSATNTSFKVKNGAFQFNVISDEQASESRVQKVARDLILKSHIILGLETRTYKTNNSLETSVLQIKLTNVPNKEEAIAYIGEHFTEHKDKFDDYFFDELDLSLIEKENYSNYINAIRTLIFSQNETSILYNNDTFYEELSNFTNHSESETICFENSSEVNCQPAVKDISYNISNVGCQENEYKIVFGTGFYAPFGLAKGSKVKVGWEFGPKGETGFWLIPIKKSKYTVTGRTKTVGCFNFGSMSELNLSVSIKDHQARTSNTSQLKIYKPKNKVVSNTTEPAVSLVTELQ